MDVKRTAVIEDMEAFYAYLAAMPLVIWAGNKNSGHAHFPASVPTEASAGPDPELLAALKNMF